MPVNVRTYDVRRRLVVRVGILAAVLVLAGALPWATGGGLAVRLIALPLLAAGAFVGFVAFRFATAPRDALPVPPAAYPAPAGAPSGGCGTCGCGGCGAGAEAEAAESGTRGSGAASTG